MKLKLFLFFLACFSLNTNAQLLWKITGKGLKTPSYLMGTHHLAPLSIMDSIKGMQTALNSTTQVIGELNMSDIHKPGNIQLLQKKMMIECDTTLQTLLSPSDYDMVNKFTKEYLNFELSQVPKLKPAFISNNAVVVIYVKHVDNFNPQEQLDSYFQKQGTEKGKKIIDDNIHKIKEIFPILFRNVSEEELDLFKTLIKKFKEDLIKDIDIKV